MIRSSLTLVPVHARLSVCAFSSSACMRWAQPNPSVILDPSLKTLLRDVDLSVSSYKNKTAGGLHSRPLRELEPFQNSEGGLAYHDTDDEGNALHEPVQSREDRKSPAARFGSDGIGAVVLPPELQCAVRSLVSDSDKSQLHSDAKRLFLSDDGAEASWTTAYDVKYKSRKQSYRHAERDATAFASVILPAHYSALLAVLHHIKHRLGPSWTVQRVIDWGSGVGGGLWAALSTFQRSGAEDGPLAANSSIVSYLGIDKRDGLVGIGKQLLQRIDLGPVSVTWQNSLHESDRIDRAQGQNTLALSAFMLSSLPTPVARNQLVKEMWESGAHTIILIDFSSKAGFENVAEARQLLLDMGDKDLKDPRSQLFSIRGAHIVAPCPHDRPCPLQRPGSSSLVCGFSQRLQRPAFLRHTKHAREGHEDIGYSYVVVQRGSRPDGVAEPAGRIGAVGKKVIEREAAARMAMLRELKHADEHQHDPQSPLPPTLPSRLAPTAEVKFVGQESPQTLSDIQCSPAGANEDSHLHGQVRVAGTDGTGAATATSPHVDTNTSAIPVPSQVRQTLSLTSTSNLEDALRREAYGWPRLVFPPLKKSGHIIIDACTSGGKIMRLTIPRSQGKQPFYDARKSSWGDLFPHPPKNKPLERFQPTRPDGRDGPARGEDIGKRAKGRDKQESVEEKSYEAMDAKIRELKRRTSKELAAVKKKLLEASSEPY